MKFSSILDNNRWLSVTYKNFIKTLCVDETKLLDKMQNYFLEYAEFHNLNSSQIIKSHERFVEQYLEDLAQFKINGSYASQTNLEAENSKSAVPFSRIEYDCSLMMSIFTTAHRFNIMSFLNQAKSNFGRTCAIGVGSGIEIDVVIDRCDTLDAFDLQIDDFPKQRLTNKVHFHETHFSDGGANYDTVIAIELLEHIEEPYALLSKIRAGLLRGGHAIITTAKNIPQFDHVYNFDDENDFEDKAIGLGFQIVKKEILPHKTSYSEIDINNICYLLEAN